MLLYQDDELLAISHEVESSGHDFLLITFAYAGMRSDGAYFWGLPLAQRLGINSIGFVARGLNWYPRASVLAAIEALRPLLEKHKRRITYGSSQGGYAALKYARALGADTSISFVPQYSIDPSVVGDFDQRFTQHFRSEMNAGMEITADDVAPNSFMVVDPHHPVDLRNAELIQAAAPGVGTIITPHTHHRPVLTIASSSVAMRMLNAALAGDALAISRELAAARRRSPHRTYHLFRAAAFRHPAWAVRIFERKHLSFVEDEARHARPLYQKLLRRLASTALQAGNLDEAIRLSEAAVRIPTGEAERAAAETQLAELLVQRGKRDRTAADFKLAASYASAAVKALPDDRRAWRVAANSLGLSHSWKQAAAAMRQALRLVPDDPAGHHNLAAYLLHAKDMPGAVKAARAAVALDPQNKAFQDRLDAALAGLQREGARAAPANGAAGRTPTTAT